MQKGQDKVSETVHAKVGNGRMTICLRLVETDTTGNLCYSKDTWTKDSQRIDCPGYHHLSMDFSLHKMASKVFVLASVL